MNASLNRKPRRPKILDLPRRIASVYAKIENYAKIRPARRGSSRIGSRSRVATPRTTFPADNDAPGNMRERIFSRFALRRRHHSMHRGSCPTSSRFCAKTWLRPWWKDKRIEALRIMAACGAKPKFQPIKCQPFGEAHISNVND